MGDCCHGRTRRGTTTARCSWGQCRGSPRAAPGAQSWTATSATCCPSATALRRVRTCGCFRCCWLFMWPCWRLAKCSGWAPSVPFAAAALAGPVLAVEEAHMVLRPSSTTPAADMACTPCTRETPGAQTISLRVQACLTSSWTALLCRHRQSR